MLEQQEPSTQDEPLTTSEQVVSQETGQAEANQFFQRLFRRTEELQAAGMTSGRARGIAMLEERISRWPPEWGDELRIIIYGDFETPKVDIHFPDLKIVVEADPVPASVVNSAMCVLKARVAVSEKSIAGLEDAATRINTVLGIIAVLNWGNSGNGWWCHVTHGSIAGAGVKLDQNEIAGAITGLQSLQPNVRRKVMSALHWIREPRQLMMEGYRSDVLQVYAGYWNAFECL